MRPTPEIVLIDDDPSWLETLADYLQSKGFQVHTTQEGREGLRWLDTGTVWLALVDVHMPTMDGLEFLRLARHRNVAVVLISSDDDPALEERALAEGAVAFLSKSMPPRLILRTLQEVLAGRFIKQPKKLHRHSSATPSPLGCRPLPCSEPPSHRADAKPPSPAPAS